MYSTCIFCHAALGANDVVERFPVGRRLAFDAAKGRLWVVCRKCARWNLTPIEERWEAIEECERRFRETRLRVSTDHIGLARLREGLELVRIGAPQRPELAAWRYGARFGRRRREAIVLGGAIGIGMLGLVVGGPIVAGIATAGVLPTAELIFYARLLQLRRRVTVRLPGESGERLELRAQEVQGTRLVPTDTPEGWALDVVHRRSPGKQIGWVEPTYARTPTRLTGEAALRAASLVLPRLNRLGGSKDDIDRAVGELEAAGAPERVFAQAAWGSDRKYPNRAVRNALSNFPTHVTLALEMAAHEESERRAMEGELAALEAMWRDAEEVAAIADNLLVPPAVETRLEQLGATPCSPRRTP